MEAHYKKLAVTLSINTVVMFLLTYVMIDSLAHFYVNVNRLYMALVMAAPMGLLMLFTMRGMFPDKRLNALLFAGFAGLFVVVLLLIRTQTPVGDVQFLRSMIPHHSGAILTCERAELSDPEVVALCGQIVKSQQEEIAQMQRILERL